MERSLILPNPNGTNQPEKIAFVDNIVIVGANGSGKSRLGLFIEIHNTYRPVKRISAQRILSFPDFAALKSLEQSLSELLSSRNRPVIELQNDYEQVLSTLFAQTAKRDSDYVELCKIDSTDKKPLIPQSAIEKLNRIWSEIFPQRKISISDSKITLKANEQGAAYSGKEMSDGEKVALYLIGQSLCLPENCLVIIDEPELHLHKSLMSRLWNKIEAERTDCLFVYITHDLDFAASRVKSLKIWVKELLQLNSWRWELVPSTDQIPENLLLEIIGSRRPILFVEGERGSLDHAIYQLIYTEFTIIPRGNGRKVIESVKGINENSGLHAIGAFGLIDRDHRSVEEIDALKGTGVSVIDFSEVENLLLAPELIRAVAGNQALDPELKFNEVKEFVLNQLEKEVERLTSQKTSFEINFKLNALDNKQIGKDKIKEAIAKLVSSIDADKLYDYNFNLFTKIIESKNYDAALKFYNNKGLVSSVSKIMGLGNGEYSKLVLRLINSNSKLVDHLRKHVPSFI